MIAVVGVARLREVPTQGLNSGEPSYALARLLVAEGSEVHVLDVASFRPGPHLVGIAEKRIDRKVAKIDFEHEVCLAGLGDVNFNFLWQRDIIMLGVFFKLLCVGVGNQLVVLIVHGRLYDRGGGGID